MFRRVALSLVLTVAWFGVMAPSSRADSPDHPVISSPRANQRVPSRYRGDIYIDFENTPAGVYVISVDCYASDGASTYHHSRSFDASPQAVWLHRIPEIIGPQNDCAVTVTSAGGSVVADQPFTVKAPPKFAFSHVDQLDRNFWPLVHDGYRDYTRTSFETNRRATLRLAVIGPAGHAVRTVDLGSKGAVGHKWQWNGKNNAGHFVAPGHYKIRITAKTEDGIVHHAHRNVELKTGMRFFKVFQDTYGSAYTSRTITPGCRMHATISAPQELTNEALRCLGGKEAVVRYRFTIPRNARRLHWWALGWPLRSDNPGHGMIRRSGRRDGPTHYVIAVKVTGRRGFNSYDIELQCRHWVRM